MSDSETSWEFPTCGTLEQALNRWRYAGDDEELPALVVALELVACGGTTRPCWINGWAGTDSGVR